MTEAEWMRTEGERLAKATLAGRITRSELETAVVEKHDAVPTEALRLLDLWGANG